MGLGNLGMGEILIILLIVLLLFGAKRIPEVAGSLGKGINEFKRNMSDAQRAITEPARDAMVPPVAPVADRDALRAAPAESVADAETTRTPKRLIG